MAFPSFSSLATVAVLLALSPSASAFAQDYISECQRLAGSIDEPNNPQKIGVALDKIDTVRAIRVCQEAYHVEPWNAVIAYRLSRAYAAYGPQQNILQALHLQRHVWGGAKRLDPEAAAWYKAFGKSRLSFSTYLKAAQNGNVIAQMSLSYMHSSEKLNSEMRKPDYDEAIAWMRKAADQGYAPAQNALGGLLVDVKRHEEAFKWYLMASEQNFPPAFLWVGKAYFDGRGVQKNEKLGLEYIAKAANAGVVRAQTTLARMILEGKGVEANPQLARKWYQMAADAGDPNAKVIVEKLDKEARADDDAMIAALLVAGFIMLIPGNEGRTPPPPDDGKDWLEEYEAQRKQSLNEACVWMSPDQAMASGCGW